MGLITIYQQRTVLLNVTISLFHKNRTNRLKLRPRLLTIRNIRLNLNVIGNFIRLNRPRVTNSRVHRRARNCRNSDRVHRGIRTALARHALTLILNDLLIILRNCRT